MSWLTFAGECVAALTLIVLGAYRLAGVAIRRDEDARCGSLAKFDDKRDRRCEYPLDHLGPHMTQERGISTYWTDQQAVTDIHGKAIEEP